MTGHIPHILFDKQYQEKEESSERGDWNQNPLGQKST